MECMDEAHYLAYGANFLIENLVISLGRFVPWYILSLGTFYPWDFCPWDVLSGGPYDLGRFILGRFVLRHFVLGRFVCAPGGGEDLAPEGEEEERTSPLRV